MVDREDLESGLGEHPVHDPFVGEQQVVGQEQRTWVVHSSQVGGVAGLEQELAAGIQAGDAPGDELGRILQVREHVQQRDGREVPVDLLQPDAADVEASCRATPGLGHVRLESDERDVVAGESSEGGEELAVAATDVQPPAAGRREGCSVDVPEDAQVRADPVGPVTARDRERGVSLVQAVLVRNSGGDRVGSGRHVEQAASTAAHQLEAVLHGVGVDGVSPADRAVDGDGRGVHGAVWRSPCGRRLVSESFRTWVGLPSSRPHHLMVGGQFSTPGPLGRTPGRRLTYAATVNDQQQTPPGWFEDPSGQQRWWDGVQWGDAAPPPVPAVPYGAAAQAYGPAQIDAEKGMATLAQALPIVIGFWGPLIIYLISKPEQRFTRHHAAEALNFSITLAIALIVSGLLMFVLIGFVLFPIVLIAGVVFHIIAALAANRGEWYRYPINLRLVSGAVEV